MHLYIYVLPRYLPYGQRVGDLTSVKSIASPLPEANTVIKCPHHVGLYIIFTPLSC